MTKSGTWSPRQCLFATGAGLALLVLLFTACGLNFDETYFYLPIIEDFANHAPHYPLSDYRFPAPPAALILQSLILLATGGSVASLRCFSALCVLPFALAWIAHLGPTTWDIRRARVFFLALAFPLLMPSYAEIKHYTFAVMCMFLCLRVWREARHDFRAALAATVFLSGAILSNQLTVPFGILLGLDALRTPADEGRAARLRALLVVVIPFALLGALLLLWGGPEPRAYRAYYPGEEHAGHLTIDRAQFSMALLTLGCWLAPVIRWDRAQRVAFLVSLPACALLVYSIGPQPGSTGITEMRGPVCSALRTLTSDRFPALVSAMSIPCAAGAAFLWKLLRNARTYAFPLTYIAIYLGVLNFVPHHFERYYLFLILPLYWFLKDELLESAGRQWTNYVQVAVPFLAIALSVGHAFKP